MAQKPDGKSARVERVAFTRPAAERIAKVVRRVELGNRDAEPLRFERVGGGGGGSGSGGVRVRVGKVAAAWAIGTCATVTLWERTGTNCVPAEKDPAETVENVANLSYDIPADSWVLIGQAADGKWYVVESGIDGSCRKTIGGEDITKWTGWDGAKQQLLGHDENGCLKWFDVEQCSTGGTA